MFRIGTTSYVIPDDILPNVEYLAPLVDDVELVLFDTDEYGSNLPDAGLRKRLADLAAEHGISYTVHLPLDLNLGSGGSAGHVSLVKAHRVIDATHELNPVAYTVHLDARELLDIAEPQLDGRLTQWQASAQQALAVVAGWLADPLLLCVENLERWDPAWYAPILPAVPVSRTIDVGHLWLRGEDPLPHLMHWLPAARVVHLHGIAERDHRSLAHMPPQRLDPVVAYLAVHFDGVVTLEVFDQDDFRSSLVALQASLARIRGDNG